MTLTKKNITITIALLAALAYLLSEIPGHNDFFIFLSASSDIFNGVDIYTTKYVDGYHYFYSVFFGILLKPFTLLPFPVAKFLWLSLNAFFLFRIFKICFSFFETQGFSYKEKILFIAIPFIFCLRFILENFHFGQVTFLILYLSLEGSHLIFQKNKWYGAVLIALGINIKLFPLVLVPLLLYRKKYLESFLVIGFTALFYFLPALFIGIKQNNHLLSVWFGLINPSNTEHVLDVEERTFHGLSTLLATLFVEKVPDVYALPVKRNIADIDLKTLGYILNGVRLALVAFTLFFLRTLPFKAPKNKIHTFYELSYVLMIVPLIFPHMQAYGFLFILPAVFCIIYFLLKEKTKQKSRNIFTGVLILVYLCCNLKLLLGAGQGYYEHFKILTYGALILIPLLAISFRKTRLSTTNIKPQTTNGKQ